MNPWLESPLLWRDVHASLITALRDDLSARLRPRYHVAIETHTYVTLPPDFLLQGRYPDVMVIERGGAPVMTAPSIASQDFVIVELPSSDPVEEGFLEVRLVPSGEVVTVIELLSHSNKQRGRNREDYVEKREDLLRTRVGFVEIDLLRAGPPMPYTERVQDNAYRLMVRRRERRHQFHLYGFNAQQPIPIFPLPLLPDDQEPLVNLNEILAGVYERAGYDLILNYAEPPVPLLNGADTAWANEILKKVTT